LGGALAWYNTEHRHAGIAMLTPETVHYGRAQAVLEQRQRALSAAWRQHPERFVSGEPKHEPLPQAVSINKPGAGTPDMAQ
jgi:putative transposase